MNAPVNGLVEPAVVVGIDGSDESIAATEYAAREAAAHGRRLVLANVQVLHYGPVPPFAVEEAHRQGWRILKAAEEFVRVEHPELDVRLESRVGHPVTELLELATGQDTLVVGRRGLGRVGRMLLGSTSGRVAGRASVPVAVVPQDWASRFQPAGPVVVALDPEHPHQRLLRYALRHAEQAGVALRVINAIDLHRESGAGEGSRREWEDRGTHALELAVKPFRDDFPTVPIELVRLRGHAAAVVLAHGRDTRMIVVGRQQHRPLGLGLGRVARELVHHIDVPIVVVPEAPPG